MKNLLFITVLITCFGCNSASILDKKFQYQFYENLDYEKLLRAEDVSDADLFLINYAVLRQRDYLNYTIEGKSYREILELANSFQQNGFPANISLTDNATKSEIVQSVQVEGVGFARKQANSKRIVKTFSFKSTYTNPTSKDIVVLNSSFLVKGPFQDHLTTINYEINCVIPANSKVEVDCVVPGKVIQKNILFEGNPHIRRIGIDALLAQLEVVPSGLSAQSEIKYFKDCFFNAASIEPHRSMQYADFAEDNPSWKSKDADGKYSLNLGNMHIPDDADEVIQMR